MRDSWNNNDEDGEITYLYHFFLNRLFQDGCNTAFIYLFSLHIGERIRSKAYCYGLISKGPQDERRKIGGAKSAKDICKCNLI